MARLLLKAVDSALLGNPAYAAGDVIVIYSDDHIWGAKQALPDFLQIDLPGVPVSDLSYLTRAQLEQPAQFLAPSTRAIARMDRLLQANKYRVVQERRQYKIDLSGVVFADGHATIEALPLTNKRK